MNPSKQNQNITCSTCNSPLVAEVSKGDFYVCPICTAVLYFDQEMTMRQPTRQELDNLSKEAQAQIAYKRREYLKELGGVIFLKEEQPVLTDQIHMHIMSSHKPEEDGIIVHYSSMLSPKEVKQLMDVIISKISKQIFKRIK